MVLYTTEGCSYCTLFVNRSLADPQIKATVLKHFNAIGMEIFNDADMVGPQGQSSTVKQFASYEGVIFSPTMLMHRLRFVSQKGVK